MTPRYEAWRDDKDIEPYLRSIGALELNEKQQVLFERGVDSKGANEWSKAKLGRDLHLPPLTVRQAMSQINSVLESRSPIEGGRDPQVESGDGHWRGLSDIQSGRDSGV